MQESRQRSSRRLAPVRLARYDARVSKTTRRSKSPAANAALAAAPTTFLGIECGGTRTVALLADAHGKALRRVEAGPANLRLLTDAQLVQHFQTLAETFPAPSALAIGMAGVRGDDDRRQVAAAAAKAWPGAPCSTSHDLETALAAAARPAGRQSAARVIILSGTGSCCYGRSAAGTVAKVGGWGHLLGDKGSGYHIGLRALKAIVYYLDRDGEWSALGQGILRALHLNHPEELIAWTQQAGKADVAALAIEVFAAWGKRDPIATDILKGAAQGLAHDAFSCARRLAAGGLEVEFICAGSVLLQQPRFRDQVARGLRRLWPNAKVKPLERESVWGAVELARQAWVNAGGNGAVEPAELSAAATTGGSVATAKPPPELASLLISPTEQRNPLSRDLDRLPLGAAIELMLREDEKIPAAILAERPRIERTLRLIIRAFRRGGRLIYIGAGTSGRMGVLDASECPPTFRAPPEQVQGIMAGGQRAIWESLEGAEDDAAAGADAIKFRGVDRDDVVVGIAASGRTPFVWGALGEAKRRGAATVMLCFNPALQVPRERKPTVIIAPNVGPEILTGSTRLKSGTATKLILNIFTTLAMVQTGKVISNLMVDVNPSNIKLRDRATRIVQALTGADYGAAQAALAAADWNVKGALKKLHFNPKARRG